MGQGLTTLCYLEKDGKYLMLHRTVKKHDVNKDKWIGIGGHFENWESPEECILRETKEETGYTLTSYRLRGVVTFISGTDDNEYMFLYTADGFEGEPIPCNEGELEWVDKEQIWNLNLWEGDKIFFRLLDENHPFFSLKLVYDGHSGLVEAALDGKPMELFDILDEEGKPTGIVKERGVAHREGSAHPTAHIWIVRPNENSGFDLLLQKRSSKKDSYPGCLDISSAGHVSAGDDVTDSAVRELSEELGIHATKEELEPVGVLKSYSENTFWGQPFKNKEFSHIYIYRKPVDAEALTLQETEVEAVEWMDFDKCLEQVQNGSLKSCLHTKELTLVGRYLGIL